MTGKSDASKAESTSDRASGKHIPAPPSKPAASDEQSTGPAGGGPEGEPGSTLNPQDPEAPNYAFQSVGTDSVGGTDQTIDQGTGVQPVQPNLAVAAEDEEAEAKRGIRWSEATTAAGREISLTLGEDGQGTTTRTEVLPHHATEQQVAAAKDRLRKRAIAS